MATIVLMQFILFTLYPKVTVVDTKTYDPLFPHFLFSFHFYRVFCWCYFFPDTTSYSLDCLIFNLMAALLQSLVIAAAAGHPAHLRCWPLSLALPISSTVVEQRRVIALLTVP